MAEFTGKNILVLGGSRGIGAAIVRRFAKGGGSVAFTYSGSKAAAEALAAETGAEAIRTDSADRDALLVATVAGRGALDVLVANAGTLVLGDPLTLDADAIDRMITINVNAPYHAAVEAARKMSDDGRIIVIGSVNGDVMPFAGGAAYALTKSAVQGMVRGLARDFGARGITVRVGAAGLQSSGTYHTALQARGRIRVTSRDAGDAGRLTLAKAGLLLCLPLSIMMP